MIYSLVEARALVENGMRLAQAGQPEKAQELVRDIRENFPISSNANLSVEVMVLEGVCSLYCGRRDFAFDRLSRASAIALSFGDNQSVGLAMVWKSLCEFNLGRHVKSAESVLIAHQRLRDLDCRTRFRCAAMTAMLFEYSGDRLASHEWFHRARVEASRSSEPSLLSALIYNIAMLRVGSGAIARLRSESLRETKDDGFDFDFVESSRNFDAHSGSRLQVEFHFLLKAQAYIAIEEFDKAASLCREFLESKAKISVVEAARARLCLAWALSRAGRDPGDLRVLAELPSLLSDSDDLALAHFRLFHLHDIYGDSKSAEAHWIQHKQWLAEFDEVGSNIRGLLIDCVPSKLGEPWGDQFNGNV